MHTHIPEFVRLGLTMCLQQRLQQDGGFVSARHRVVPVASVRVVVQGPRQGPDVVTLLHVSRRVGVAAACQPTSSRIIVAV